MLTIKKDEKTTQELEAYAKGVATVENVFLNVEDENKLVYKIKLELQALGSIYVNDYGQSVLVKCVQKEQYLTLCEVEDLLDMTMGEKMTAKNFFREDTFFLKLATKDGKYKAEFDPTCDPSSPEKSGIKAGTMLVVDCQPGIWMNLKNDKAGMFLSVEKVVIDGGKKKRTRK